MILYLASTSPRRKGLLRKAGFAFRILKPRYREEKIHRGTPAAIVRRHAVKKAESCLKQVREGVVLAADTVVSLEEKIFGKPRTLKEAARMLGRLEGRWHTVVTGVAIFRVKDGRAVKKTVFAEKTRVRIKVLPPKKIASYFKKVNPLDKAGSYAIQSRHGGLIRDVRGSFSNAVGLPVEKAARTLRRFLRPAGT